MQESGRHTPRRRGEERLKTEGTPITVKVRLSTKEKDVKVSMLTTDSVRDLKRKVKLDHGVGSKKITMLYSGRVLSDGVIIKDLKIPKGFVIQAIVT